jgi:hypothetical protein
MRMIAAYIIKLNKPKEKVSLAEMTPGSKEVNSYQCTSTLE